MKCLHSHRHRLLYGNIKRLFKVALEGGSRTHILLAGPPASAKTMFLTLLFISETKYGKTKEARMNTSVFANDFFNPMSLGLNSILREIRLSPSLNYGQIVEVVITYAGNR
jgi:hypothetical protein